MNELDLIMKIEKLRRELNVLVLEKGMMAEAVLEKSKELDEVLNLFNQN
ncbi:MULTISPECIES: aspartyl-phosphate phosphatase Spo0E family protein [Paenibacillus]|nr:aspartyl-phosphate phosphatase Spo0E family protein [Paenibacillus rhizosphaerae]